MQDFDPLQPETFDSVHVEFHRLRKECPVAHTDTWGGYWAVTRYDDVEYVASKSEEFVTSVQNVVPRVAFTGRRPPLHLDPPEHTPYRKALAPLFSPKRIAELEPIVTTICEELLQPMVRKDGGDICTEYASVVPIQTFANWMNLPESEVQSLTEVGRRYNFAVQDNDDEATKECSKKLYDMARSLLQARKAQPLDPQTDATSALLAVRVNGEPLPEEMVIGTVRQVLVVGIIAPTVMFGSIAVHLARDPVLQQNLRENPTLIPDAVEEFLRLYTPYRGFARTPVNDVVMRGRTIPKDEPIAVVYAAANRDPDIFERPDEFILNRPNIKQSLAFGRGPHRCVGASMARLEMVVALKCLLAATQNFRLAGPIEVTRMPEVGALRVPLLFS